jgi:hypothetical protein
MAQHYIYSITGGGVGNVERYLGFEITGPGKIGNSNILFKDIDGLAGIKKSQEQNGVNKIGQIAAFEFFQGKHFYKDKSTIHSVLVPLPFPARLSSAPRIFE